MILVVIIVIYDPKLVVSEVLSEIRVQNLDMGTPLICDEDERRCRKLQDITH